MTIDIEEALTYKLINTSAISTLISTRMHPLEMPSTPTLPLLVYTEISAPTTPTMDETAANALINARYQIDAWSTTYSGAVALGKAVFDALHGYAGVITKGADSFTIQACLRVDKRTNNDADTGLFWVSQDFMISY